MSNKNLIIAVAASLLISASFIAGYHFFLNSSKIGYVRTGEVINSFSGFKQAQSQFENEYKIAQSNADTLQKRLNALKGDMGMKRKSGQEWAYKVGVAENELMQYQKNAQGQLQTRQQELSRNAIDQINLFIQDYGKANGYKLILGSTENGSILYGKEADDVTKQIVEGLNKKYPATSPKN